MTLRDNAKRRGKIFTITFEYFVKFAVKYDYLNKKGVGEFGYGVDCKKEELGYSEGNLRLLSNPDNTRKENKRRKVLKYDYQSKEGRYVEIKKPKGRIPF